MGSRSSQCSWACGIVGGLVSNPRDPRVDLGTLDLIDGRTVKTIVVIVSC